MCFDRLIVGFALGTCALLGVHEAAALDGPATRERFQVTASVLAGRDLDSGGERPLGLGFGGRVGYSFPSDVYFGLLYERFLGNSIDDRQGSESLHLSQWQLIAGRDFALADAWVLRPSIAAGIASRDGECTGNYCSCENRSCSFDSTRAPGASTRLELLVQPGMFQLSAEAAANLFFFRGATIPGLTAGIHGGVAF